MSYMYAINTHNNGLISIILLFYQEFAFHNIMDKSIELKYNLENFRSYYYTPHNFPHQIREMK